MAVSNSRVKFVYVSSGQSKPQVVDENTIYFLEGTHEIHVGAQVICAPTDLSSYATSAQVALDIETALNTALGADISVQVTGSGNAVLGATYNSSTKQLSLNKGDLPEYLVVKKVTPNVDALASYQLQKDGVAAGVDIDIPARVTVPEYTIARDTTSQSQYTAPYNLLKDGVATGDTINIPKDLVVSSGELKTVTTPDVPYSGAQVGDKYIELTIANANNDKIYIPVNDLVDAYTGGTHISVSNQNAINHDAAGTNVAPTIGTDGSTAIHVSGQVQYDSLGHVISVADKNIYSNVKTVADASAADAVATWTVISNS